MPVAPSYPGVYVDEVPSGVHPITGVPTAVAAFVGWFPRGELDRAIEVLSFADVEREFGGLHRDSDTSFALYQFFLNGGARAHVVRVAGPGTGSATLNKARARIPALGGVDPPAFIVRARSEGDWGNRIRIQVIGPGPGPQERFDLIVSLAGTEGGRPVALRQEVFRGLTAQDEDDPNYVRTVVNAGSALVTVDSGELGTPAPTGLMSGKDVPTLAGAAVHRIEADLGGTTRPLTLQAPLDSVEEVAGALQSALRTAGGADPEWAQAEVHAVPDQRDRAESRSLQVLAGGLSPDRITFAGFEGDTTATTLHLTGAGAVASASAIELDGGGDGGHPGAGELVGSPAAGTGMYALENTDFTLLCLPSLANGKEDSSDRVDPGEYPTVVGNAITFCRRKRALLLLDPPDTVERPAALRSWLQANSTVRDPYTALYYPRLRVADPTRSNRPRSIGPCGAVAGLMARIDAARGVWKAPAGTEATLHGLQRLDYDLTDPENGTLNPVAVNCLRTFPAYGTVSWGARTTAGSDESTSEYRYVPVRRLANFLESSLHRGLRWVVFEPNDEPLWSQIRLNIGSFLHGLFRQGAFAGRTPRQAYLVRCDASTTTSADQALGVVNVLVGFAPLRPAEFVVLRIQQIAGQTES